jgi:hypothetical protein
VVITLGLLIRAGRLLRRTYLAPLAIALAAAYVGFLAANATYDIWFDDDFHWVVLGAIAALAISASAETEHPEIDTLDAIGVHERGPGAPAVSPELLGADST